jgi:hypothetical protein
MLSGVFIHAVHLGHYGGEALRGPCPFRSEPLLEAPGPSRKGRRFTNPLLCQSGQPQSETIN